MACQPSNISTRAHKVAKSFEEVSRVTAPNFSSPKVAGDVKIDNAHALFKLWAGNLGVFHLATDTRSLDYRLRQEREVTDRVFEILDELEGLLNKILAPVTKHTTEATLGEQAEPLDEAEAFLVGLLDLETSPECQSTWLAASITDSVRRLFKISALIERSTARDRYAKAEGNVECQFSDQYDVAHVRDKHGRGSAWLLERLGKAITKRRQFLKYAELHRNKLESLPQTAPVAVPQDVAIAVPHFDFSFNKSHAPSHFSKPSLQNTTASTLAKIDTSFVDDGFDGNRSSFSAATSIRDGRSADRLRVVKLEEVTKEKGEYFLCPYCRTTQKFNGQFAWEQHVYSDLRAYICTFRQCGMRMFEKKSAWMQHELEEHRRVWTCQLCDKTNFANDISLAKHLEEKHQFTTDDGTSTALVEAGSSVMKMIPVDDCPLCDWQAIMERFNDKSTTGAKLLVPAKRFMKHVAGHLEELALFALPRLLADEDHDQSALSRSGIASTAGLRGDASELSLDSSPSRPPREVRYTASEDGDPLMTPENIDLTEHDRTNNGITSDTSPIPGFPCVFHRGGSPSRDVTAFCHERKQFVSQLSHHHARRFASHPGGGFFYCQRCFIMGSSDEAFQDHNCQFVCVTDGCPNYALPASNHEQPCWHGNENDERSIWRKLYRIRHDITDHDPRVPDPSDPKSLQDHAWRLKTTPFESDTTLNQDSNRGMCPVVTCGRHVKDLKTHMLTHQNERPEKCPIPACAYHIKGFARKYDKNRHALTHYKGTMVCGFCPGRGSAAEKSFNRADVFKRHLTSVHGVEQTPPNARRKRSNPIQSPIQSAKTPFAPRQSSGMCSTCENTFASAQDFYEHLDDCVLRVVQQSYPCEAINEKLLAPLVADSESQQTMVKHMLPISDDKPARFEDEEWKEDKNSQINKSATKVLQLLTSYKEQSKIYPDGWGMPFVAASDELIQPFSVPSPRESVNEKPLALLAADSEFETTRSMSENLAGVADFGSYWEGHFYTPARDLPLFQHGDESGLYFTGTNGT